MLLRDLPVRVIKLANISAPVNPLPTQATYPFQRSSEANQTLREAILSVLRRRDTPKLVRSTYLARHLGMSADSAASIGRTCAAMARQGLIVGVTRGDYPEWGRK